MTQPAIAISVLLSVLSEMPVSFPLLFVGTDIVMFNPTCFQDIPVM